MCLRIPIVFTALLAFGLCAGCNKTAEKDYGPPMTLPEGMKAEKGNKPPIQAPPAPPPPPGASKK